MFTAEELSNILVLLNRVDIKGNEAEAVAFLKIKINKLLTPHAKDETAGKGDSESTRAEGNDGQLQEDRSGKRKGRSNRSVDK